MAAAGVSVWKSRGVLETTWSGLGITAGATSGAALDAPALPDKTVQVKGTFAGGTVVIEGSNDGGTTYHTLNDSRGEGNALSLTTADTRTILENPGLIRPRLTTASGATSITVVVYSQSTRR
jgi:hypothetical protein